MPDYAQTDIYQKCPKWTRDPKLKKIAKFIREKNHAAAIQVVNESEMFSFDLQEIIDHLLIDFGDYHQPVFDADRDGFSAVSDGLRGASWRGQRVSSPILSRPFLRHRLRTK